MSDDSRSMAIQSHLNHFLIQNERLQGAMKRRTGTGKRRRLELTWLVKLQLVSMHQSENSFNLPMRPAMLVVYSQSSFYVFLPACI